MPTSKVERDEEIRQRFSGYVENHQMTVIRDDGLYRHLRFNAPGTYMYGFDLVTWPGYLVICGDIGDYTFSRVRDMFDFFDGYGWGINPDYWAQKLQGPWSRRDLTRHYSEDAFTARLHEWARDEAESGGWDFSECEEGWIYPQTIIDAIDRELRYHEFHTYEQARATLDSLEHDGCEFGDAWEWDLTEYDHQFLTCCWAIVWGIKTYRAAQPAEAVAA